MRKRYDVFGKGILYNKIAASAVQCATEIDTPLQYIAYSIYTWKGACLPTN